jgi:hypothetical protein
MKSIYFLLSLFAAALVFYDAKMRGRDNAVAFLWCLGTQLLVIVFLPLWLWGRPEKYPAIQIVERPTRCAHCGK